MRQILLDHLFRPLADRGTKIPASPEVPSPVALLQHWKLLEQFTGSAAFDPPHDLARRHVGRGRDEDVHMILADDPLEDLDLEDFAHLPDQLPHTQCDIACENLVAVLRDPDKVILDVVDCMTAVAIVHSSSPVAVGGGLLYAVQHSGDEICPPEGGGLNLTHGQSQTVTPAGVGQCADLFG